MALLQNITARAVDPIRYSAYHGCNERVLWGMWGWNAMNRYAGDAGIFKGSGVPDGYAPGYAWLPPKTAGSLRISTGAGGTGTLTPGYLLQGRNLGATIDATGAITIAQAIGAGNIGAGLAGSSEMTQAYLAGAVLLAATIAGAGSMDEAELLGNLYAAATLTGSGSIDDADISASVYIAASLAASGNITNANLAGAIYRTADIAGQGDLAQAVILGAGILSATIEIGARPSAADIASAIWGAIGDLNNVEGTMGRLLNNSGGSADPNVVAEAVWAQLLADNKVSGSFGEFVQKLLTVAKYLGLK